MSTDTLGRPAWIQLTEKCRHFNGFINDRCKADVAYESVRDTTQTPYAYPCFIGPRHPAATTTCALASFRSEAEAKTFLDEARVHHADVLAGALGSGTADDPLQVLQMGYRCLHAELRPKPRPGQHYRVVIFADSAERCDACKAKQATRGRR